MIQAALVGFLALIVLDFVFGIVNAILQREFSSEVMRKGIGHKSAELGYVMVGLVADGLICAGLNIGITGPVLAIILGYLCVMEIGSLLEIFSKMNPDIAASRIGKVLASVKPPEVENG